MNILFTSRFLITYACPEKQSCPEIFYCIEYIFYYSGFLSNLRLPWKTEFPWNFSLYWNIFIIQDFWATSVCPKNRVALKNFTVWNMLFTFRIFEQFELALKNRVVLEFFTVLKTYFLSFRIFELLALALKTELALKFFTPGGAAALPNPPPRTPMGLWKWGCWTFLGEQLKKRQLNWFGPPHSDGPPAYCTPIWAFLSHGSVEDRKWTRTECNLFCITGFVGMPW